MEPARPSVRQAFTRRLAQMTVFLVAAACTAPLAALTAVRNARRAMHVTLTTLVKLFAPLAITHQPDRIIAWRVDPDTTALRPDPAAAHNAKLAMKRLDLLSGYCVPKLDRPVTAYRNHAFSIWSKCDIVNSFSMSIARNITALESPVATVPFEVVTVFPRNLV